MDDMIGTLTIDQMLRLENAVRRVAAHDMVMHWLDLSCTPLFVDSWLIAERYADEVALERIKKQGNLRKFDSYRDMDKPWKDKLAYEDEAIAFWYTERWLRNETGFGHLSLREYIDGVPEDYDKVDDDE